MPNQYIDAFGVRHEADEVITGLKDFKRPVWSPNEQIQHFSPEVIMRESDYVTFAPGIVKKRF